VLRAFDLVLSATGLLLVSPLLLVLTIAGVFDTGSPLFRQTRVGRNRKPFTLVKFRTMRPETGCGRARSENRLLSRLGQAKTMPLIP
jgi:O-antigen biosynthesis protein WbqP